MVKFLIIFCSIFVFLIIFKNYENIIESFKPNRVLAAYYREDLGGIRIILREDNSFEYILVGMFGGEETINGKYIIKDSTLELITNADIPLRTYTISESTIVFIDEFNHHNLFEIYELNESYFNDLLFVE